MKKTYENIQGKYQIIQKKYQQLLPIVTIGVFIIIIIQFTKITTTPSQQNYNTTIEQTLTTNFYQESSIKNGVIQIILGTFNSDNNIIQSHHNLIEHKWYILPNQTFITDTNILLPKEQYEQSDDKTNFLRTVAQTLLYTTTSNTLNNPKITLWTWPNKYFEIECFQVVWNMSPICNENIDHFIRTYIFYDTTNYQDETKTIIEQLLKNGNNKQKQAICQSFIDDIRYNKESIYSNLIQQCPIDIQKEYEYIKSFIHAHTDITLWLYQATTYKHMDINIYKLMSMLQYIYTNAQDNNINTRRIEWYILFMQQILRNHNSIPWIYKDLAYRINTRVIAPQLENNSQTNTLRALRTLHNGSDLLWFPWLESIVSSWIVIYDDQLYISGNEISLEERLTQNNFLKITNQEPSWSWLKIEATITVPSQISTVITLYADITIKLKNNSIIVENINIQDNPEITQAIQKIQESTELTIAKLYQFLSDNIDIYQTSITTLCDQIQESLKQGTIQSCNREQAIINKKVNDLTQLQYKISRNENFQIQNIQINDEVKQEKIQNIFSGVTTNNITLPLILNEVMLREDTWEQNTIRRENTITSTQIRSISTTFNEFLDTTPTDIVQIQDTIVVQFRIKDITFVTIYDEQTKTISPLFFNDTKIQGIPLKVENFSLSLSTKNQNQQNTFAIDPLLYIKSINEPIYNLYIQLAN